ncbi:MAG: hypothetical protein FD161_3463 [Limisphaerales bacterium]|nr:MAG: hypothetical protein FD161_3463 [Limisphaerales bacterium]KAG0507681.1 MAG: hypothetical protein E1N63_3129 [Limisphaerales bacterium]TXT52447.1 MAG: hypothetical protein FD140_671 [Limisphaerales bacterium]
MFVGLPFLHHRAAWGAAALLALAASLPAAVPDFKGAAVSFMKKHCYDCHGEKQKKADLDLTKFKDDTNILKEHKLWKSILQQVNSSEMPPKKQPQPTPQELAGFNSAIENSFALAEKKSPPDPGRVTLRRLNRTEYNHTVRDLVNVDFNPAENFPADDIGHGFDNIGDVLSISPVHLERYLAAAEGIAARAIVLDPPKPPTRTTASIFLEPGGYGTENSTRPVTRGFLLNRQKLTLAGDYVFRVRAGMTNAPDGEPVRLALLVDDVEKQVFTVTAPIKKWENLELNLPLPVGEHTFSIKYLNPVTSGVTNRMLFVQQFQVVGPADTRPEFQQRVAARLVNTPDDRKLREFTQWFLTRAFRRPPTPAELDRYLKVAQAAADDAKGRWEAGVQQLLKVVLCSPKFLFRVELDSLPRYPGAHPLDEYQLAARLSYFLWSTMPDDELLALAAKHQLTPALEHQVRRMLKDPKAESLTQNFALQWLQLERLKTFAPDNKLFPNFDERLRRAMLRETELFFGEIVREDRSVLDLIDADFTYVNDTLARHYGLNSGGDASGRGRGGYRSRGDNSFNRVTLTGKERGGLLTHASILTVTSNPTRTSPVKRGKWVLEQILGTPPPPPPPNVLGLEQQKQLTGTLRQRMEQHRENPACANCHKQMDALGFAFENFDAIGRFRSKTDEGPIDPSGTLPDGKSFQGPAELKAILKGKQELVVRNLAEQLLTYGIGRGLEFYDNRALNQICAQTAKADHKFSALITAIVKSDPFRLRRGTQLVKQQEGAE